eukprot:5273470-Pyramimonas_sp.AAC.1
MGPDRLARRHRTGARAPGRTGANQELHGANQHAGAPWRMTGANQDAQQALEVQELKLPPSGLAMADCWGWQ